VWRTKARAQSQQDVETPPVYSSKAQVQRDLWIRHLEILRKKWKSTHVAVRLFRSNMQTRPGE